MTKLKTIISTVLQQLKPEVASDTWESRRRYFNQMIRLAEKLNITEPCQELYDAFIADDNGSKERRSVHIRCVKLIDALAGTRAMDGKGILFNEQPMPTEAEVHEFFLDVSFPIASGVYIDYLIVKASIEMRHLNLTDSTIGQYMHSWIDIQRYFYSAGSYEYDDALMQNFIQKIRKQHNNGSVKEWKWKINRKAAYVLMEVAKTGCFYWKMIHKNINCKSPEIENVRLQYVELLKQKNLSKSTIELHDYVFRKAIDFARIETANNLQLLSPENVQLIVTKLSGISSRRSMATLLPILRSILNILHIGRFIKKDLSGMIMGGFVQRGSVAAYISKKDQAYLIEQLDKESKRTKAIIILALRLGLRDCDICNLTFQEIDWQHDKIRLIQQKTGEPLVLPLLPDVGNALMDYIINDRPRKNDLYQYVFLRKQAPYHKLSSVYATCSKLLNRLGIHPVNGTAVGVHLFRYSLIHKLLAAKVPHQVITDTLGHISKESDKPYLSMEESMLRMCSLDLSVIGRISWERGDFQ
jgi:integrase